MEPQAFITTGQEKEKIPVRISYRIIELFSDGLYSSPNKAIEELVANAFDAGASNVHVILSPDRAARDATIVIVDDGSGMNAEGLRQHWLIGQSNKRDIRTPPKKRKQIGKFGIGKLATFVLGRYLTHVCKYGGKYYATTMDYNDIPEGTDGGMYTENPVELSLRELTEQEAKEALGDLLEGTKPGYKAIRLFGKGAQDSWTVAIMSGLKDKAPEIRKGRLSWVLRTAMPLRDDFKLFLDGEPLLPSKADSEPLKKWVLGKDILKLSGVDDLEVTEDERALPEHKHGLTHSSLGRITGYAEIFENLLDEGKSDDISRSHGFFVYAHGRLINLDDALFGLPALRHGTFARFRMVTHIDRLDEELRSTREAVSDGPNLSTARNVLKAVFNEARNWLQDYEQTRDTSVRSTKRIAMAPGSLTRRPLLGVTQQALSGKINPRYTTLPGGLSATEKDVLLSTIRTRAESDDGLVQEIKQVELTREQGISVLDIANGLLQINLLHPFVIGQLDTDQTTLQLLAMAEVLTEAYLYELGLSDDQVHDGMRKRDELLRQFARSIRRTADLIAQDLVDASTDKNWLEKALIDAFDCMGFETQRIGGSGRADGKAVAPLSPLEGQKRRYAVSLEAKSKEKAGATVSAKSIGVSAIARQRKECDCEHAVVIAPEFPTSREEESVLLKEAIEDKGKTDKTITFIRITDLAKLVRLVALKNVGLDRLKELFETCTSPHEAKAWIDNLENEQPIKTLPLEVVLQTIWELQDGEPSEAVEFQSVTTVLKLMRDTKISKEELVKLCHGLSMLTPWVVVRENSVELMQRPDKIIKAAGYTFKKFPESEQAQSVFKF